MPTDPSLALVRIIKTPSTAMRQHLFSAVEPASDDHRRTIPCANTDGGLGLVLRWCAGRVQNVNFTTLSKRSGTYKGTMTTGACELLYRATWHRRLLQQGWCTLATYAPAAKVRDLVAPEPSAWHLYPRYYSQSSHARPALWAKGFVALRDVQVDG
jgi:hypothetical protein